MHREDGNSPNRHEEAGWFGDHNSQASHRPGQMEFVTAREIEERQVAHSVKLKKLRVDGMPCVERLLERRLRNPMESKR